MNLLYLYFGENKQRIDKRINELIEREHIDSYNISTFDMEEVSYNLAINEASSIPFLSDYRLVICKNCYFFQKESKEKHLDTSFEKLKKYLDNPMLSTIVVFIAPYASVNLKGDLAQAVNKMGLIIECKQFTPDEIKRDIDRLVNEGQHKIETSALHELTNRLINDPTNYLNELEKLELYLNENEDIEYSTVDKIISKDPNDNVFDLISSITNRDRKKTIETYYDLLKSGSDPRSLLGLIIKKLEEILYAKELTKKDKRGKTAIEEYFQYSSGRAYFLYKNATEMKFKELIKHLEDCIELDYKIKTGQIDDESGLELFLLKI